MARKRFTAEQIIMKLREAEVGLAQGQTVGQVCKQIGVTEQTYYRWRKEYGGLRLNQANDWRQLEFPTTTIGIPHFFRADPDHEGMVKDQQVRRLVKLRKNEKMLTMAAAKAGLSRKTARKYLKSRKLPSQCQPERYWRNSIGSV